MSKHNSRRGQVRAALARQAERFLPQVNYTRHPNELRGVPMSPGARATYGAIAAYAQEDGYAFPSLATLARDVSRSISQVIRYIKELVSLGLLRKQRRGMMLSNLYHLLPIAELRALCSRLAGDAAPAPASERAPRTAPAATHAPQAAESAQEPQTAPVAPIMPVDPVNAGLVPHAPDEDPWGTPPTEDYKRKRDELRRRLLHR